MILLKQLINVKDFDFTTPEARENAQIISEHDRWDEVEAWMKDNYPNGIYDDELEDCFIDYSDEIFKAAGIGINDEGIEDDYGDEA